MKRILVLLLFLSFFALPVTAADTSGLTREQYSQSGASGLSEKAPSGAKKALESAGVTNADPNSLVRFTPASLLEQALSMARSAVESPLRSLAAVVGILLCCGLLSTLKTAFGEKPLQGVFDTVCTLCIAAAVLTPVIGCIRSAADTIREAGNFSLSFVPVFAGLAAASGHPASATVFQTLMISASQIVVQIASTTFVPMVGAYLALCVAGSAAPGLDISGLTGFIKKTVSWALGLCVTLFVAILTMQSLITGAADSISVRAAKFVVGSAVPVIGSAVSDAVATVMGCANLVKTATGVYAVLVFVLAFLPPLLECALWMLAMDLSVAAAEILSAGMAVGLLKSIRDALSILLALVLTAALTLIVSVSVMLLMGMN